MLDARVITEPEIVAEFNQRGYLLDLQVLPPPVIPPGEERPPPPEIEPPDVVVPPEKKGKTWLWLGLGFAAVALLADLEPGATAEKGGF